METEHPLERLETTTRAVQRVQTETLSFRLHEGDVIVRNETYEEPSEHEYRVIVRNSLHITCGCLADEHYTPACKHRIAVAIRDAVLDTVVQMQFSTDGGHVTSAPPEGGSTATTTDEQAAEEECDCSRLPEDVPCWPCYRDGHATFDD